LALLGGMRERVEGLDERRGVAARGRVAGIVGLNHGKLDVL